MDRPLTDAVVDKRRRRLVAVWVCAAVVFGGLVVVAEAKESPLDDSDPAWQRPGFLDAGSLPLPAPPLPADLPRGGQRTVVFFVRADSVARLCQALVGDDLGKRADLVLVVSGPARCESVSTVEDPAAGLARAYGLRPPRDGGAPVGYAVVDRRGRIRYRTLDPAPARELGEVATIVGVTP